MASSEWRLLSHQYDLQKELAEFTFQQNMQATRDERAYNTPSNQLDRLRQAGLNPLYYGLDGNSSNGAPFTMSTPQAPNASEAANAVTAKMQLIQGGISQLIAASKNMAEVNRMAAETDLLKQQAQKTAVDTDLGRQQLVIRPAELGLKMEIGKSQIYVNEQNGKVSAQQVENLKQAYVNAQEEFKEIGQRIAESQSRVETNTAEQGVLRSQAVLNGVLAESEKHKQNVYDAQAENLRANTQISYEDLFTKQIKNGYLPKQMLIELGIQGQTFEKQQQEIENLKKYGKLLDTQDTNLKVRLLFDGAPLNCWKDENGNIQFDSDGFVDYWKNLNRATKLQKYAEIYRSLSSGRGGTDFGALVGAGALLYKTGFLNPVSAKGVGTPPPPIYY